MSAVEYFDQDVNTVGRVDRTISISSKIYIQTGKLTSDLSINPQKIDGLAGVTISSLVFTNGLKTLLIAEISSVSSKQLLSWFLRS